MEDSSVSVSRSRRMCRKCKQLLSYSAYNRHQNPLVCPEPTTSANTDYASHDFLNETELDMTTADDAIQGSGDEVVSSDDAVADQSSDEDEEVEIVDAEEDKRYEECTNTDSADLQGTIDPSPENFCSCSSIIQYVCYIVSFFQLCYKLSDRAITLLLVFLRGLLCWIALIIPAEGAKIVTTITNGLPKNVYFLKQYLSSVNPSIKAYVVCPKCCKLYQKNQCLTNRRAPVDVPKCDNIVRKGSIRCNAPLYKRVKQGSHYKLVPKNLYSYYPIKESLVKLYSRPDFHQKCELWRKRNAVPGLYTDIYDGAVWNDFLQVDGKPFLSAPYNLCLKLNVDWIQPYDHTQYSMGLIYLVIENLPRSERFKVENIILVGCIPGPREPKRDINTFLSPMVDELLDLWNGIQLRTSSLFGFTSLRCALTCVSSDLPATRKVCGFAGHSAAMGCSKCKVKFKSGLFGDKLDYSGYNRDSWQPRDRNSHMAEISFILNAKTKTEMLKLEKQFGTRYSELLRLPYFDVVRYHCVDVMHNLLLGTAKNLLSVWLSNSVLTPSTMELIQEKVDKMATPAKLGRIPQKISSIGSSFTADQWKNWVCVYSLYALHGILPSPDYNCMVMFVRACIILLQPTITLEDLGRADDFLLQFCQLFEELYGKERCTPNMHLHCHIRDTVTDYGPVYTTWCFAFERYNGVFESFQKNWIYPEVQLMTKFLQFQNVVMMDMPCTLPTELTEIFQAHSSKMKEIVQGKGSVFVSHIDSTLLTSYLQYATCPLSSLDACMKEFYCISSRRHEKIFTSEEVIWLSEVYRTLYSTERVINVPLVYESFYDMEVLGEHLTSEKCKGSMSSCVSAFWAGIAGRLTMNTEQLRIGVVKYFFVHDISLLSQVDTTKRNKVTHIFAKVRWFRTHPRETWLSSPLLVVNEDFDVLGPSTFIPVSRIQSRCAIAYDKIQFDFGEDSVFIVSPLKRKLST